MDFDPGSHPGDWTQQGRTAAQVSSSPASSLLISSYVLLVSDFSPCCLGITLVPHIFHPEVLQKDLNFLKDDSAAFENQLHCWNEPRLESDAEVLLPCNRC